MTERDSIARDDFSLNAALVCQAHEHDKLERLCRYVARGPIALEHLSIDSDGLVVYALKHPFRSGTTHVCCTWMYECRARQDAGSGLFEPLDFIARLATSGSHARAPTWCATMDCSHPLHMEVQVPRSIWMCESGHGSNHKSPSAQYLAKSPSCAFDSSIRKLKL